MSPDTDTRTLVREYILNFCDGIPELTSQEVVSAAFVVVLHDYIRSMLPEPLKDDAELRAHLARVVLENTGLLIERVIVASAFSESSGEENKDD